MIHAPSQLGFAHLKENFNASETNSIDSICAIFSSCGRGANALAGDSMCRPDSTNRQQTADCPHALLRLISGGISATFNNAVHRVDAAGSKVFRRIVIGRRGIGRSQHDPSSGA
jgi:hypothetical protein